MKKTRILAPLAIAVSAVTASTAVAGPSGYSPAPPSGPAAVYEAGTAVVRFGASYVDPDESSGNLRNPDIFPEWQGMKYDVDGETTWQFSAMVMPLDHWSIEYGYIGESDHDVDISRFEFTPLDGDLRAGNLERYSSTLMINWFPVCKESWIQPYVGFGANYTDFKSVNLRPLANEALVDFADAVGPGRVSVDDAWGWAGQIGVDIMFGRDSNWLVNAAVQYHDVETTTNLRYAVDGVDSAGASRNFMNTVRSNMDFDPWVYNLGIGYKF